MVQRGSLKHMKRKYANPLTVLGDVSRLAIVAVAVHNLLGGDFRSVESVVLAWVSPEPWKLTAYREFFATGDPAREPYTLIASTIFGVPPAEITKEQRKIGKTTDLASSYSGSLNAFRNFSDEGSDDEVMRL